MGKGELLHAELTDKILGGCYAVYKVFGFGFLEAVYRNALAVELARLGLIVKKEVPVEILYLGVPVGTYRIDLLVNDKVIVESKTQKAITVADEKQLINYLKATPHEVGLVFNFGPEPKFQRMVYSNSRK
ncbi:MAG: GxxExxY protein [Gemmatimonadaceae bacterium]